MMISPDISTERLMLAMEATASRYPQGRLRHVRVLAMNQENDPDWIAKRVGIDPADIEAIIQIVLQGDPGEGPIPLHPWTLKAMRAMEQAGQSHDNIGQSMTPVVSGRYVRLMLKHYRSWTPI